MSWGKRLALALPFVVAAILNVLVTIARPLPWRAEHIAGYCFLFAMPWAWLLDRGWLGPLNTRWLEAVMGYLLLLWVPALLYSGCLWLLFRASGLRARRVGG